MIQHFHFWAYSKRNWKQGLKDDFIWHSKQHLFIIPQIWKQHKHPLTNEWMSKVWYIIQWDSIQFPKGRKFFNMLQHEWILRTFAKWNKPISHTHTHKIQILQDFTSMRFLFSFPVMSDSVTPQTAACQASLSPTIFQSLPKFMPIASVMPSSHLILWHPLLLLPSVFPRDFSNESAVHIRWSKYWNLS